MAVRLKAKRSELTVLEPKTIVSPAAKDWARLSKPGVPVASMFSDAGKGRRFLVEGGHIPAEHGMIGAQLIVDLRHRLPLVAVIARAVLDLAARIGRARKSLGEVHRGGTEPCGIDPVVHEPAGQVDLPAAVARGRGEGGKVAGHHCSRGNPGDVVGRRDADRGPLVGAEEKELVPDNRPAQRPAELVAPQPIILPLAVRPHRANGLVALNRLSRRNSNTFPEKRLVPDFVTALTEAPECIPFWADRPLVATLNSCSASGKGSGRFTLSCGLLCMAPSRR